MSIEYDEDIPVSQLPHDQKLACFKDWLKWSRDVFAPQRAREEEDLLQQFSENRWPEEAKQARKGRPMISISLTQGPLQFVYNQAASSHFGVDLKPVSEKAQSKLAERKKGLFSRIQRDGGADQARMWAFDRASQAGMGWYRIGTQWDEDSDNPSDQEICYIRLLFQDMVWPDPSAQKPDFSDATFIGLGGYVQCRTFRRLWSKAKYKESSQFGELHSTEPDWVRADGKSNDPLVVELFYKEITSEEIQFEAASGTYSRQRERVQVRRAVLTACEVLEDAPWMPDKNGIARQYIPLVPVIGKELQPVKGERRWEGMVRPAKDAQLEFDYANSQAIEDVGAISKAKYLVVEGQIEGYEQEWRDANRTNLPYLQYRPVNLAGGPAPPPQLMQVDGTKMQLSLALAQTARELAQTATQGFEPLEVPKQKAEQSGRAILALEQKADAGRSHYIQNFKDISLPLDARIVLDMMPVVYDRAGRITHILGGEDKTSPVMLNAPFVVVDGKPVPVDPNDPAAEMVDLAEGKYAIVPTMGKPPQTRLEEGQEFLAAVLKAAPELLNVMGDLAFKYRDEPGAKEIAERLERQIRSTTPHLLEDDESRAQDAVAKAAAMEQQLQMLTQEYQKAVQYIQTEQAKHEAAILQTRMKEEAALERERMKNATSIAVAQINAAVKGVQLQTESQNEALATGLEQTHESIENEKDRQHEREMAQFGAAHDVGMAAASGSSMTMRREGGKEGESERSHEASAGRSRTAEPQADGAGE